MLLILQFLEVKSLYHLKLSKLQTDIPRIPWIPTVSQIIFWKAMEFFFFLSVAVQNVSISAQMWFYMNHSSTWLLKSIWQHMYVNK